MKGQPFPRITKGLYIQMAVKQTVLEFD